MSAFDSPAPKGEAPYWIRNDDQYELHLRLMRDLERLTEEHEKAVVPNNT